MSDLARLIEAIEAIRLSPEQVIRAAFDEYNRRMAEINKRPDAPA